MSIDSVGNGAGPFPGYARNASDMLRVSEMPGAQVLVAKIVFWLVWIGFIVSAVDALQPARNRVEKWIW